MRQAIVAGVVAALGLGLAFAVLGAAGRTPGHYDIEMGTAQEKVPMVVRLDTESGQLCAFVFDQVEQRLVPRGCHPHMDKGL
jgi:hypothetical protein